ncbi:MAG: hypothetical protein KF886_17460 [Candidatus Hydrogenedentes bacterium]|nr:hypothetical protein [Candidatus Hydrogenedentota bacterium]
MKQMGLVFKMYASMSEGERWPQLARNTEIWAPDIAQIFPEFLSDPTTLVAREHPAYDAIVSCLNLALAEPRPDFETAAGLMAMSFAYLDCSVIDEPGFRAMATARRQGLLDGSIATVTIPDSAQAVFPMREEIGCDFLGRAPQDPGPKLPGTQSARPVLIETWGWKNKSSPRGFNGAHVLYMDGHVEFVKLGTFPVVPEVMDVLSGIAGTQNELLRP